MFDTQHRLHRDTVGTVTVGNDSGGFAVGGGFGKQRKGLRAVSVWREMKTDDKSCFAVDDEPKVMLDPCDFHHGFVSMPLIRA